MEPEFEEAYIVFADYASRAILSEDLDFDDELQYDFDSRIERKIAISKR
jgi:hypothetical protein